LPQYKRQSQRAYAIFIVGLFLLYYTAVLKRNIKTSNYIEDSNMHACNGAKLTPTSPTTTDIHQ